MPRKEFPEKPLEVIEHLRIILGEIGFGVLQKPIVSQVRETFGVKESEPDLAKAVELAKRNYLQDSL